MNLDEIRARLAGLNAKTQKRKDLWKPKDKHVIRFLSYPHGDEHILELGFHYDIGNSKVVYCPLLNDGNECVICEYAEKLKEWKDDEVVRKQDFAIFRKLQVKSRWYAPMVERGKESEGPKFWAFGKTIYESLLGVCLDEENNEEVTHNGGSLVLTDTKCAYDVTVEFSPATKDSKGNIIEWPKTTIKEKKRPSKLLDDDAEVEALLGKIVNIAEVYPPVSSEEVEKIFAKFLGSEQKEVKVDDDVGTEYKAKSNNAEEPVINGQSIDDAFGDLVGEEPAAEAEA